MRSALMVPLVAASCCLAQEPDVRFSDIVVTATRVPQEGFNVPAAIDHVDMRAIREDKPQVNLSESLNRVPGIVVRNRENYAQDLQISSRGFGARATFGVRGVRLIADGIPATMPDGQGQAASFNLSSAERIEVLRGPFASLYGNSSGGVVQIFTADGPPEPTLTGSLHGGSDELWKGGVQLGGQAGALNYVVDASRFETDGYRRHSAAVRDHLNAKLRVPVGPGRITLVVNVLEQPGTQDPLGLTRAQFEDDPRQVDPAAIAFNTRKSVRQNQAGIVYDQDWGATRMQARIYGGTRDVLQFLGQGGDLPLGSGGVVDLGRRYAGAGLRATRVLSTGASPLTLTAGLDADRMEERRRGFVNDAGSRGALRRDEDDIVSNSDVFAQAEWAVAPRWILSAGARYSRVRFESRDHYIAGPNPDDSGSISYSRTTPVAGILFKLTPGWNLYANAGAGFETPTFAELAYRPGGQTGLNFALEPAKSRHYEVGAKGRFGKVRTNLALFRIRTDDEIVTNSSSGGRTDFKNASRTQRDGVEWSLESRLPGGFEAALAYTWLDARFTEAFGSGSPPTLVPSGAKLPGVARRFFNGDFVWRHPRNGFHAGVEVRSSSRVFVNEANSDAADAYTVAHVRAGMERRFERWLVSAFARVDNVTDRRYAGSVIVSEARGRFFEPAPGRTFLVGLQASRAF